MMEKLGMEDDQPLESKMVTRAIETAQGKVEAYNFDIRKHVVEYDDVMNTHRDVIYGERDSVLAGESMRETVLTMLEEDVEGLAANFLEEAPPEPEAFRRAVDAIVPLDGELPTGELETLSPQEAVDAAVDLVEERYAELERAVGEETQRLVERFVLLRTIDALWVQHLTAMEEMRQGICLRAVRSVGPAGWRTSARPTICGGSCWRTSARWSRGSCCTRASPPCGVRSRRRAMCARARPGDEDDDAGAGGSAGAGAATATQQRTVKKVGRNQPCPCGSGKKYKRCHGSAA